MRTVTVEERGQFLVDYIALLEDVRVRDDGQPRTVESLLAEHATSGTRGEALQGRVDPASGLQPPAAAKSHDRWVVNKIRALGGYYTKGIEGGPELRHALNSAPSLPALRELIARTFRLGEAVGPRNL